MKRLILFLFLVSLSFANYRNPCELFLQGIQASSSEDAYEAVNCSVLTELTSYLIYRGSKKSQALGYISFWDEVFVTNSTQSIEIIQDQDFTVFYKAISEKDYFTLGTQAFQLPKAFSDDFEVWIRGSTGRWGALDGFFTWQKQDQASSFDPAWNEQKLLFFKQDGFTLQRFDPALGSSYAQSIAYAYGDWGLLGSRLVQANMNELWIYDSPATLRSFNEPSKIITYTDYITELSVFSLKTAGEQEGPSNDFIFLVFRNAHEGRIISPDGSQSLRFPVTSWIRSSIVVKLEGKDILGDWQYKNFLVICTSEGYVELISFTDDLSQLENRKVISDKKKNNYYQRKLFFHTK